MFAPTAAQMFPPASFRPISHDARYPARREFLLMTTNGNTPAIKPQFTLLPVKGASAWTSLDTRYVVWLFALGLALRGAFAWFVFGLRHERWSHYLLLSDGSSFVPVAKVLWGQAPIESLGFYDSRVFPGWPAVFGDLLWLLPEPLAALGLAILMAAIVPVVFYVLTRAWPAACALVWLPPAWLLASVHPISESLYLLLGLGALWCWQRDRLAWAGALAGVMCATKPYGVFLAVAVGAGVACHAGVWSWRRLARYAIPVALVGAGCVLLNVALYGDALRQLHVYASPLKELNLLSPPDSLRDASGHWSWPLKALIVTPWLTKWPLWKLVYIYGNAVAFLILLARPTLRFWRSHSLSPLEFVLWVWLAGNTAASCSGGPYWGFASFDRYVIWALPAAIALNADLIAAHPRWHFALGLASIGITVFAVAHHGLG